MTLSNRDSDSLNHSKDSFRYMILNQIYPTLNEFRLNSFIVAIPQIGSLSYRGRVKGLGIVPGRNEVSIDFELDDYMIGHESVNVPVLA